VDRSDPLRAQNIIRLDLLEPARQSPETDQTWLDPEVIKAFARAASDKMVVQRPERSRDFRAATDEFVASIDTILRNATPPIDQLRGHKVIALDNGFAALTRRLGIEQVLPVGPVDPARLSDADARRVRESAKQLGVRYLLLDASLPLGTRDDLATRTELTVLTLDSLGSSSDAGHRTYQSMLQFNLKQLLKLLGEQS
jgi:ABC-type Zn uptake system ZnuABC Zn-binding protein ZnuA